jgi:hypothetical protein
LEQRKALALGALLNEKTRVDKRLVRAFRHWQKELLSRYLELLNERMRDAKKSVIVKRFKLIVRRMSLKLRSVLLRWQMHAKEATVLLARQGQLLSLR